MAISFAAVFKRFGAVEAIKGVDLKVAQGEIVALLGPNGAGKTTAISLLLGLRRPSSGTVRLFGHDPESRLARSRRGAMLQEAGIPGALRVGEVVDLFRAYYPRPRPRDDVLATVGILDLHRRPVTSLSGGQRQ